MAGFAVPSEIIVPIYSGLVNSGGLTPNHWGR
jgi:hypothetical protein